ncbi:MAG: PEPxxWA-CTERM sorting domain-containing protein [Pseudomonadota bacterium]
MKRPAQTLLALVAALGFSAAQADAVNFAAVTASANVNTPDYAHDGVFPAEWTDWTTTTAWWTGFDESMVFEFDQVYVLTHYDVSLDNNDSYEIQFSLDGTTWGLSGAPVDLSIGAGEGNVGYGMDTFSGDIASIRAKYARVMAVGGDGYNSVGELSFNAAPVPEPETYALMLAGLGLVGFAARRRARD